MLRVGSAVLVVVALLAVAALALGQEIVPIKVTSVVKVIPNKAGTPAHPQGVKVDVRVKIDIPHDYDPPLVEAVDVWLGKGALYNGANFPTCSFKMLERSGVRDCPRGSIMGWARAVADADGVKSYPRATIVNGGANIFYAYVVLSTPARVQQAFPIHVTKLNSPRWSYRLHFEIPRNLQIVAGIPLRAESLHIVINRAGWWASTSCPKDHRWRYHGEGRYASGQVVTNDGSVACRS